MPARTGGQVVSRTGMDAPSAGLARRMLSQPGIEGDPLALLKINEAYWKVRGH